MADLKPAKKSYDPPSFEVLDARAAKAELKARAEPEDATVRQMFLRLRESIPYDKFEIVVMAIVLGCAVLLAVGFAYLFADQ